jgi:hypothetical protein
LLPIEIRSGFRARDALLACQVINLVVFTEFTEVIGIVEVLRMVALHTNRVIEEESFIFTLAGVY